MRTIDAAAARAACAAPPRATRAPPDTACGRAPPARPRRACRRRPAPLAEADVVDEDVDAAEARRRRARRARPGRRPSTNRSARRGRDRRRRPPRPPRRAPPRGGRRRGRRATTRAPSAASAMALASPRPRLESGDDGDLVAKLEIHAGRSAGRHARPVRLRADEEHVGADVGPRIARLDDARLGGDEAPRRQPRAVDLGRRGRRCSRGRRGRGRRLRGSTSVSSQRSSVPSGLMMRRISAMTSRTPGSGTCCSTVKTRPMSKRRVRRGSAPAARWRGRRCRASARAPSRRGRLALEADHRRRRTRRAATSAGRSRSRRHRPPARGRDAASPAACGRRAARGTRAASRAGRRRRRLRWGSRPAAPRRAKLMSCARLRQAVGDARTAPRETSASRARRGRRARRT